MPVQGVEEPLSTSRTISAETATDMQPYIRPYKLSQHSHPQGCITSPRTPWGVRWDQSPNATPHPWGRRGATCLTTPMHHIVQHCAVASHLLTHHGGCGGTKAPTQHRTHGGGEVQHAWRHIVITVYHIVYQCLSKYLSMFITVYHTVYHCLSLSLPLFTTYIYYHCVSAFST